MHKLNYEYIYQQWAIFSLDIMTVPLKKPQLLSVLTRSRGSNRCQLQNQRIKKTSDQQSQTPALR